MKTQMTLREVRKQYLGLTQAEMAAEMGVSRRTYIRYELGVAPVRAIHIASRILKSKRIKK